MNFIDLFAGCGGLSEGFIRAGFNPIAHIEMDEAASYSLKTRMAYHWLLKNNKLNIYNDYLCQKINREEFYSNIPLEVLDTVINKEISENTIYEIFNEVDDLVNNKRVDLIIGGPPCQAYSVVGRSRDQNKMLGDKRNYLFEYYVKFLNKYKPKYFVFENVLGLLSAKDVYGNKYIDTMFSCFEDAGYRCEYKILSAEEYGVPQKRKRVIIVGKKTKSGYIYPKIEKKKIDFIINDLFSDLPKLNAGEGALSVNENKKINNDVLDQIKVSSNYNFPLTFHVARPNKDSDLEIYKIAVKKWQNNNSRLDYNNLPDELKTHNNRKSFTDRFKVVAGDLKASHTVVAHISKDGHYYIHPDIKQNRSLTPREAARIQTFPDDYYFESATSKTGRTAAYKQIGNAVPVYLAEKIAIAIKENW